VGRAAPWLRAVPCEQPPYSILVRGIEAGVLPTYQKYGMGVVAWSPLAGGWLAGRIRQATGVGMASGRARRILQRFGPSLPGNAAKLAAVEELIKIAADAGCSLTHLAVAFVTGHLGVTSAIIGPRTMEQLTNLLAGASVVLDDGILDRIDQIVPPGVTLNAPDAGCAHRPRRSPPSSRRPRRRLAKPAALTSRIASRCPGRPAATWRPGWPGSGSWDCR
jgi:aryl-alcohol dehydrogenase-like predicted oxidoreductase